MAIRAVPWIAMIVPVRLHRNMVIAEGVVLVGTGENNGNPPTK